MKAELKELLGIDDLGEFYVNHILSLANDHPEVFAASGPPGGLLNTPGFLRDDLPRIHVFELLVAYNVARAEWEEAHA